MDLYERALDQLVKASGDGRPVRQDTRELNQTIKVGEVVAVLRHKIEIITIVQF